MIVAARTAEIKAYVVPDVKAEAAEVYAHWGMSLSDAINTFLVKSIDVGGLPLRYACLVEAVLQSSFSTAR